SLLEAYRLGVEQDPLVVLDRSPFLLPLARLRNDYEDYGLLMVDSREARLYLIRSDILEEKSHSSIDLMNKHKKGGMCQMRFNRLRAGAIKSFLSSVADDLSSSADLASLRGLIVAGPGEAKSMLLEEMPESLRRRVMDLVDIPMDIDRRELVKIGDGISREEDRNAASAALEGLKSAVLKGRLSACGPKEAHQALEDGRVSLLVIKNDFAMPAMVCHSCQIVPEIQHQSCPSCGGHLSQENVAEELLRLAQRTGAEVVLADHDQFLESIGGVGAILRS
ncbi:MAG TPA: Vms1/Ankzf1 family peptidyl-tRNA hydrolase, partial [Methanotrichaceae archaeon]|nr:Vms1/Ankzf1 family peptidyl-tRNA hydrolase [Methanotrichaceae archaeon]